MAVACPETGLHWFALKVRSRAEKTVGDTLIGRGFEVFCPTYMETRQYSDRCKYLPAPLFPGYLFCKLSWNNRLPVLSTPHVEYVVGFGMQPSPVGPAEVEALQSVVRSGSPCQPHPFLRVGQRVRMQSGPLADVEGILVAQRGVHRLIVSVDLLQRSVAAEVDSSLVCPV
jgi:transcription antitermination factor NusG